MSLPKKYYTWTTVIFSILHPSNHANLNSRIERYVVGPVKASGWILKTTRKIAPPGLQDDPSHHETCIRTTRPEQSASEASRESNERAKNGYMQSQSCLPARRRTAAPQRSVCRSRHTTGGPACPPARRRWICSDACSVPFPERKHSRDCAMIGAGGGHRFVVHAMPHTSRPMSPCLERRECPYPVPHVAASTVACPARQFHVPPAQRRGVALRALVRGAIGRDGRRSGLPGSKVLWQLTGETVAVWTTTKATKKCVVNTCDRGC